MSYRQAQPTLPGAPPAGDGQDRAATATCAMCGIELAVTLMVADGGQACADIRHYCRDAGACTQRWTERLHRPNGK